METAILRPAAARAAVERLHLRLGVEGIAVGQAMLLAGRHLESGVDHAEGCEDAIVQDLSKGLALDPFDPRSEENTSELQSLMSNSYAVFCLKKKKHKHIK